MEAILKVGDQICDFIPFVSTATNLFDLYMKYAILSKFDREAVINSEYYTHIYYKEDDRMIALIMPIINIISAIAFAILDLENREWDDKDKTTSSLSIDGQNLHKASPRLKDDIDVVMEAVRNHGKSLQYASERLKNDFDVVLAAVYNDCSSIEHLSPVIKKRAILSTINRFKWEMNFQNFGFNDDKDIALAVVAKLGKSLEYTSDRLKDDLDVVITAMIQDGTALKYAGENAKDNYEIANKAVDQAGFKALEYASPLLRKQILLERIHQKDCQFYIKDCKLQDDKEVMLAVIAQGYFCYMDASDRLKDDEELALAATKSNRHLLKYASDHLKDSKQFFLKAIRIEPNALEYASDRLKEDLDVVQAAFNLDRRSFNYASEAIKSDSFKRVEIGVPEDFRFSSWN